MAGSQHAPEVVVAVPKSTEQQIEITSWTTGVLVFLVVIWSLLGPKLRSKWGLAEGSSACALGLACGATVLVLQRYVSKGVVSRLLAFSADSFFTYLLPPVIFYAGLSVKRDLFFTHLPSILALGVLGTVSTCVLLAAFLYAGFGTQLRLLRLQDCLALGAIFSATDSVATLQVLDQDHAPVLFSLVFGEGVINDATSVVLLGAINTIFPAGAAAGSGPGGAGKHRGGSPPPPGAMMHPGQAAGGIVLAFLYLLATSLALGLATGCGVAWLVQRFAAQGPHHEVALIGLLSYLSYLLAEVMGLSGILSLFCCGIVVSHLAINNISAPGRTTTLNAFRTLSYISEGMIFIYLGMDALDPAKWRAAYGGEAAWLCITLLILLLLARAAAVLPIVAAHNWLSTHHLSSTDAVIIWWAGLMRGAVSVALAYYYFDSGGVGGGEADRHRATLIAATLVVVLCSTLVLGALTHPLMQWLVVDPDRPLIDKCWRAMRQGCSLSCRLPVCMSGAAGEGGLAAVIQRCMPCLPCWQGSGAQARLRRESKPSTSGVAPTGSYQRLATQGGEEGREREGGLGEEGGAGVGDGAGADEGVRERGGRSDIEWGRAGSATLPSSGNGVRDADVSLVPLGPRVGRKELRGVGGPAAAPSSTQPAPATAQVIRKAGSSLKGGGDGGEDTDEEPEATEEGGTVGRLLSGILSAATRGRRASGSAFTSTYASASSAVGAAGGLVTRHSGAPGGSGSGGGGDSGVGAVYMGGGSPLAKRAGGAREGDGSRGESGWEGVTSAVRRTPAASPPASLSGAGPQEGVGEGRSRSPAAARAGTRLVGTGKVSKTLPD